MYTLTGYTFSSSSTPKCHRNSKKAYHNNKIVFNIYIFFTNWCIHSFNVYINYLLEMIYSLIHECIFKSCTYWDFLNIFVNPVFIGNLLSPLNRRSMVMVYESTQWMGECDYSAIVWLIRLEKHYMNTILLLLLVQLVIN